MEPSGPVTVSTDRETIVLDVLQLQSCDNVKLISQLKGLHQPNFFKIYTTVERFGVRKDFFYFILHLDFL